MKYIAAFDIGTTNVKGILVTKEGRIAYAANRPLQVLQSGEYIEQHPDDWTEAISSILAEWFQSGAAAGEIALVSLSGQMQDMIPLNDYLRPVRPAILYSDGRAGKEADDVLETVGAARIDEITGNPFNGTLVFPKLMWFKKHEPESYDRTKRIVISAKDYVAARLTGRAATDFTSAATAGCMNLHRGEWDGELIDRFGIRRDMFPDLLAPGDVVGTVHDEGARASGLLPGTPVLCGFGDAGASTLGAGVYAPGQAYLYLGTTGWAAAVSEHLISTETGAFNLGYYRSKLYIPIAPLLNVGNVHRWAAETFGAGGADDVYQAFDQTVEKGLAKRNRLLFLPYLNGERCPVQDPSASGSFIGIRQDTTREEMAAAALEGISLSMRQVVDILVPTGDQSGGITAIGGGAKSRVWCQLIADVLQMTVHVPEESPYLPALGAAQPGFEQLGWDASLQAAADRVIATLPRRSYFPDRQKREYYQGKYEAFQKLYPALKQLWE